MKKDIGIDLGSSHVTVVGRNSGVLYTMPSLVARNRVTGEVIGYGGQAELFLERTPGNVRPVYPVGQGISTQYDLVRDLIGEAILQTFSGRSIHPRVILTIPAGLREDEEQVYAEAALDAGAREVYLIENSMAAALGAGIDISSEKGRLVVDLGAGHTEVSAISMGGSVASVSFPIGGKKLDEAIISYVGRKYDATISPEDAEALRCECGTVWVDDPTRTPATVPCVMRATGLPHSITVTPNDIAEAIAEAVDSLVEKMKAFLSGLPADLAEDVRTGGMVLCGGMATLTGLDAVISEDTGLTVTVFSDPQSCTAQGLLRALDYLDGMPANGQPLFRRNK